MQRTSPVLQHLSEATSEALIEAFCTWIEDRRCLERIFPWIWQLTQPSLHRLATCLPIHLQQRLHRAVHALQSVTLEDRDQVEALEDALAKLWPEHHLRDDPIPFVIPEANNGGALSFLSGRQYQPNSRLVTPDIVIGVVES